MGCKRLFHLSCSIILLSLRVPLIDATLYKFESACNLQEPAGQLPGRYCRDLNRCTNSVYPQCGSDGETYRNECVFRNRKCVDSSLTLKKPPGQPCNGPFKSFSYNSNGENHVVGDDGHEYNQDGDSQMTNYSSIYRQHQRIPLCGITASWPCHVVGSAYELSWLRRNGYSEHSPIVVWDYDQSSYGGTVWHPHRQRLYVKFVQPSFGAVYNGRILIGSLSLSGLCVPETSDGKTSSSTRLIGTSTRQTTTTTRAPPGGGETSTTRTNEKKVSTTFIIVAGAVGAVLLITTTAIVVYWLCKARATKADELPVSSEEVHFEGNGQRRAGLGDVEAPLEESMWRT